MTAPVLITGEPLTAVARPARGRALQQRRAIALAGGQWLCLASQQVRAELECAVGLTRCSPVLVTADPPHMAAAALDQIDDVIDPWLLHGSRIALQAVAAGERPWLWLFVAECYVLWPQLVGQQVLS